MTSNQAFEVRKAIELLQLIVCSAEIDEDDQSDAIDCISSLEEVFNLHMFSRTYDQLMSSSK